MVRDDVHHIVGRVVVNPLVALAVTLEPNNLWFVHKPPSVNKGSLVMPFVPTLDVQGLQGLQGLLPTQKR